jgi:hypothetical protein
MSDGGARVELRELPRRSALITHVDMKRIPFLPLRGEIGEQSPDRYLAPLEEEKSLSFIAVFCALHAEDGRT